MQRRLINYQCGVRFERSRTARTTFSLAFMIKCWISTNHTRFVFSLKCDWLRELHGDYNYACLRSTVCLRVEMTQSALQAAVWCCLLPYMHRKIAQVNHFFVCQFTDILFIWRSWITSILFIRNIVLIINCSISYLVGYLAGLISVLFNVVVLFVAAAAVVEWLLLFCGFVSIMLTTYEHQLGHPQGVLCLLLLLF